MRKLFRADHKMRNVNESINVEILFQVEREPDFRLWVHRRVSVCELIDLETRTVR